MPRYTAFTIREFAGLNEDENPDSLADNELSVATNTWKHGKAVGTRPGLERDTSYDAAITGAKAVHGIAFFPRDFDANDNLIVVSGGDVWTSDTNSLDKTTNTVTITTAGTGTSNAGTNLWTFATHKNRLYAAGGANSDSIWYYDPGASATLLQKVTFQNGSASSIDAKFIFEKWNFGFLCGMNGAVVEDNPTIFRYSAIDDMTKWPVGNSVGGTSAIAGISSYGDEFSTGFGEYTDNAGDWLLFLTNRQIYPTEFTGNGVNPFRIASGVANGCVSQRAFVNLGIDSGDAVYLSNQGIHSLRQSQSHGGAQERYLSWKIRPTFARINQSRIRQSVGAYWPEEGIALFAVPTGSSTYNDTILCLDLKGTQAGELNADTARWFTWQLSGGFNANVMGIARDSVTKKRYLYIGDTAGNVLRFNRDIFTDVGSAYSVRFVTKHNDFGAPGVSKGLGDLWIGMQPGGSYQPSLRFIFDYGRAASSTRMLKFELSSAVWNDPGDLWGSASWGGLISTFRSKVFGTGQGDTIAMEFSHAGNSQPFRVTTLMQSIRSTGETLGISTS